MLKQVIRSILRVGLFLCLLVLLPFALYGGWHLKIAIFDNPRYAAQVFSPYFEEFEVLESRRWHKFGAQAWDCSYAIASLPAGSAAEPPEIEGDFMSPEAPPWFLKFGGGNWTQTPKPKLSRGTRDAVSECMHYWAPDTARRLQSALAEPGSYVIVGSVGETVYVYSQPQRIAARIRFGD